MTRSQFKQRILVAGFFSIASLASTLGRADVKADFERAIAEQYALVSRAYATGDAELFRGFYTADAVVLGENTDSVVGVDTIVGVWKTILPNRKSATIKQSKYELSKDGTIGYSIGALEAHAKDASKPPIFDTLLLTWRKVGKQWRCSSEMFVAGRRISAAAELQ